ncbi:fahd1 [Symbiodinium sp. CCMP2456]|nr:fahd1 [Symbiodinium sp. CCMP2456]
MAQIGSKKDEKFLSEAPKVPVLFLKPTSSYLPMGSGPIRLPRNIGPVHHEVELGIVIGQKCKSPCSMFLRGLWRIWKYVHLSKAQLFCSL